MDNNQIWQAVLGEIELTLSKANFTTWFKQTFISSFKDEQLIICVPNNFTKAWLETKYHKKIASALKNITNKKIKKIFYKIETKQTNNINNKNKIFNKIENNNPKTNNQSNKEEALSNRFGLNSQYTFKNFIVGKGNELAHAACHAVAANPGKAYNPLFIYGEVGLGKTHLLQAIGHEVSKNSNKILYVSSEKFTNDYVNAVRGGRAKNFKDLYRNVDLLLIDDIQFLAGKDGSQEEFFHTFNELHQTNKQIVIASDRAPKSIPALEKRLRSRLEWGMVADVVRPNIETRLAILNKKCQEKNYTLCDDVLDYVANNIQNNIRELEGALNKIIVYHEFNNSTPTLETTKGLLNDIISSSQLKSLTSKNILDAVSKYYNISTKDIISKGRKKELIQPRQITIYLMREENKTSYPTIGKEIGGRDHTTAIHAYNKISKKIKENNDKTKQEIDSIKQLLRDNMF